MTEGNRNSIGTTTPDSGAVDSVQSTRATRRALLKAAVVAMPLIITLRGKPAHAQLSSLGSAGITYGPGAYVTSQDIDTKGWDSSWLGEAKNSKGEVLLDKTRRSNTVGDPTKAK